MYDAASDLYNELLWIYFDEYYDLLDATRSKMDSKYNPINVTLDEYDYKEWYKEGSDDSTVKDDEEESYDLPQLKSDEEVKERKGLKILTSNKLFNY